MVRGQDGDYCSSLSIRGAAGTQCSKWMHILIRVLNIANLPCYAQFLALRHAVATKHTPHFLICVCMHFIVFSCYIQLLPWLLQNNLKIHNIRSQYTLIEQSINFLTTIVENIMSVGCPNIFCLICRPVWPWLSDRNTVSQVIWPTYNPVTIDADILQRECRDII